jgi:folate-binding protein YgfZ
VATPLHDPVREHEILHTGCGLVDRSERGKLWLTGADAKEFLHGQVTNDVEGLREGAGCYAAFLTHKGKMVGDLRILDCGDGLWLDCERGVLQELFNMIRRFKIGRRVELEKRTLERGLLSLIGPEARGVARAGALPRAENSSIRATVAGHPVRLVATDVGVDVICAAEQTGPVAAALRAAGAEPVVEAAAETLRVEHGRPRWGLELDESVIPQEAGLNERAVSFTKGCYVGQETVARLFYKGKPNRHLRGLRLSASAATGDELRLGDKVVGHLGTVVESPEHGPIALAIVRREAGPQDVLEVGADGVTAEIAELPFGAPPAAA